MSTRPILLLNTTIITNDGSYTSSTIDSATARRMTNDSETLSAIGHEATAKALSTILGFEVPVNRIAASQEIGQYAIALKLNGRIEEGRVLTLRELEEIGYELKLMVRSA